MNCLKTKGDVVRLAVKQEQLQDIEMNIDKEPKKIMPYDKRLKAKTDKTKNILNEKTSRLSISK